jgi:hypothetical protein
MLTARSTLADVAAVVARALEEAGIPAVLTGGACATLYSKGAYQSSDLDFILRGGTRRTIDDAMKTIGFTREADRYVHRATPFFVEFPRGPLAIGDDFNIRPVSLKVGRRSVQALSATDSCRDRLAAFYHWSDRQSLEAAVEIARRHRVSLDVIRRWSEREGHREKFEEFESEIDRRRPRRRRAE